MTSLAGVGDDVATWESIGADTLELIIVRLRSLGEDGSPPVG
jgi:hypothetical protein